MLTKVCGVISPAKGTPTAGRRRQGAYRCPRCNGRLTRPKSVKDHFIKCVEKYGNPAGLRWFDHQTLASSRDWHLNHVSRVREEGEEEGDEEEEEMEEEVEAEKDKGEKGEGDEEDEKDKTADESEEEEDENEEVEEGDKEDDEVEEWGEREEGEAYE